MLKSLLLVLAVLALATCVQNKRSSFSYEAKMSMLKKAVNTLLERKEAEREGKEEEDKYVSIVPGDHSIQRKWWDTHHHHHHHYHYKRGHKSDLRPVQTDGDHSIQRKWWDTHQHQHHHYHYKRGHKSDLRPVQTDGDHSIQLKRHVLHAHIPMRVQREHKLHLWPVGTYGLLMPSKACISKNIGHHPDSSCPMGHWVMGQRYHDTNDHANHNTITPKTCLKGSFNSAGIKWNFCIQQDSTGPERPQWPPGSYCIFKKGHCPNEFQEGSVKFDDKDRQNQNSKSGVLPDGVYDSDTIYEFCCRTDGSTDSPMTLPTDVPFYLLGATSNCQAVHGMRVNEEMIFFGGESHGDNHYRTGSTPNDSGDGSDHKFRLCYYEKD